MGRYIVVVLLWFLLPCLAFEGDYLCGEQNNGDCEQIIKDDTQAPASNFFNYFKPENDLYSVPTTQQQLFDELVLWLQTGGATFDNLDIRWHTDYDRGLVAKTDLAAGTSFLRVPLSMMITMELARNSPICTHIMQTGWRPQNNQTWMALYILQERFNPQSFWRPHINIFPRTFPTLPQYFTEEEISWFEGSFAKAKHDARMKRLRSEYDTLIATVPGAAAIKYDDLIWASAIVLTRNFQVTINGVLGEGLVPLADMLNHKLPRPVKWDFDDNEKYFWLNGVIPHKAGDEIFASYGSKCNHKYLLNYGFTVPGNSKWNEARFIVELPAEDNFYKPKEARLTKEHICQIYMDYSDTDSKYCFSWTRKALFDGPGWKNLPKQPIIPMTRANELAVLKEINRAATKALAGFSTTMEEDENLLKDETLTINHRNVVVMRIGEKEVLHYYADLYPIFKELLEQENVDILAWKNKYLDPGANGDEPIFKYLQKYPRDTHRGRYLRRYFFLGITIFYNGGEPLPEEKY